MAVRADAADVPLEAEALAAAFPDATGRVVVFLHGWCESDDHWRRGRERRGTTYGEELTGDGWTPVFLRANSGLSVRRNGAELAGLLEGLVDAWPVPVERIALVGHSMGGLVIRAAGAVQGGHRWPALLTDVVTLGTPHLGAPLAGGVHRGSGLLGRLPEAAAFGRDPRPAGRERRRPDLRPRGGLRGAAARALPARLGDPQRLTEAPGQRHPG